MKEYETNPYFRIKMKVAMKALKENTDKNEGNTNKKGSKVN